MWLQAPDESSVWPWAPDEWSVWPWVPDESSVRPRAPAGIWVPPHFTGPADRPLLKRSQGPAEADKSGVCRKLDGWRSPTGAFFVSQHPWCSPARGLLSSVVTVLPLRSLLVGVLLSTLVFHLVSLGFIFLRKAG